MPEFVPSGYLSIHEALNRLVKKSGRELRICLRRVVVVRVLKSPEPRGHRQQRPRRIRAVILRTRCTKRSTRPGSGTWMRSGRDPRDASGAPTYFVLLDWVGDRLIGIRDFRHARYATDGAELLMLG
jgi:hypothetical protein